MIDRPLTTQQTAALAMAVDHGGKLIKFSGAYWTFPGCPHSGHPWNEHYRSTTIEALVRRGHLQYTQWVKGPGLRFPVAASLLPPWETQNERQHASNTKTTVRGQARD